VHIVCSPEITSVFDETIMFLDTPSIVLGLPALPIPKINPFFIPISALMIPSIGSIKIALVITRSRELLLFTPLACPIPSRILLPPPKTSSSPYIVRSFSISIMRSVSANLILSPFVGPYNSTYCFLGIFRTMTILPP
jgi:hypothetical protein